MIGLCVLSTPSRRSCLAVPLSRCFRGETLATLGTDATNRTDATVATDGTKFIESFAAIMPRCQQSSVDENFCKDTKKF